jgi:hypothetical protein
MFYFRGCPKSIFLVIPAAAKRNAGILFNGFYQEVPVFAETAAAKPE